MKRKMSPIRIANSIGYSMIIVFLIIFLYQVSKEYRNEKLLENGKKIVGIIINIHESDAQRDPDTGTFLYLVGGVQYQFNEAGDFSLLSLKDTVLIEYSQIDPSVARVVDKYYMKKHWHLKNR